MAASSNSHGTLMQPEEVDLLGVPVTCFTSYQEAVAYIMERIRARDKVCCVAINPWKLTLAKENPSFGQIVKSAGIHICDGVGTAFAARVLYGRSLCRITGAQLFFDLAAASEREGLRIFLLGASPESNQLAYGNLRKRYPGLKIVGWHHGYFEEDKPVVDMIRAADPDILFVAMGSPKQECWMAANRDRLNVPFLMGVGGTFDIISGKTRWAPALFRRTGTEFLYRTCMRPKRILGLPTLFMFVLRLLKERICPQETAGQGGTHAGPQEAGRGRFPEDVTMGRKDV